MKFICIQTFLLLFVTLATTLSYERYYRSDKHPGKCVIQGQVVNPGQSIKHPAMDCAEFTCDNSIGLATIETCDPISALPPPLEMLKCYDHENPPKCNWGDFVDTKVSYPKCCDRQYICVY